MPKKKIYTIFALFFGNWVYVGKTTSPRISAVYRRHVRGEVFATHQCALENPHPTLHILHIDETLAYEIYYWILAYVNVLQRAGYHILNSPRTIARSTDLRAPALAIISEIEKEGLEQLLARTRVERPTEADRQPAVVPLKSQPPLVNQKINIWLNENEKQRFIAAAKAENLTYRQLLLRLLNELHNENQPISGEGQRIVTDKLETRILALEEKIRSQKAAFQERIDVRDHKFQLLQSGLIRYFELMQSAHNIPLEFETGKYRDYPSASEYIYPAEEGPYIMRPTALLYGHGKYPARFLLGIGDNQQRIKLRFYPNNQCAGVSLASPIFNRRGSVWLIGAQLAPDGAMDLSFAFPLDIAFRYNGPTEYGSEMNRFFADFFKEIESYPK